jgi:elongation factor 1-alpha
LTNGTVAKRRLKGSLKHATKKIDPRTGQVVEEKPAFLKTGDAAVVKMEPLHPIAVETFAEFEELGRFAVRDMGTTVAAGIIKEITKKGP